MHARIFALACLSMLAGTAVHAPVARAAESAERLAATDLFAMAENAKSAGRYDDAEAIYDALTQDSNPDIRAEARYRKGLLLADQRKFADAAVAFRALLDEQPDAVAVRLELARMLAAMGDEGAARRQLRQAQAGGLPDDVAVVVDQFSRVLRSTKRTGASIEVALAPDNNINRATQARRLDTIIAPLVLSSDARARSGLGVRFGGQAYTRIPLATNLMAVPRIAGTGSFYHDSEFNDVSGSALLGLELRSGKDRITGSFGRTQRWYGNDVYARSATAAFDWVHPLQNRSQLLAHVGVSRANYILNDLQDGTIYDASLGFEHALSPRSGFGTTIFGYRQTARDPGYAAVSGGVSFLAWQDIGKTTFVTTSSVSRLVGDERLFLFPDKRKEWLLRASGAVTLRQASVAGFAPTARLVAERNVSSVGIYDYDRLAAEFAISRAF